MNLKFWTNLKSHCQLRYILLIHNVASIGVLPNAFCQSRMCQNRWWLVRYLRPHMESLQRPRDYQLDLAKGASEIDARRRENGKREKKRRIERGEEKIEGRGREKWRTCTIICSKGPPSAEMHAAWWSHLIWHNLVTVGDNLNKNL